MFLEEAAIYTIKGIAEASIPDRYGMITQLGRFFLYPFFLRFTVERS